MTSLDFSTILPEVVLAAYALIALLAGAYFGKDRLAPSLLWATVAVFLIVAALIGLGDKAAGTAFYGMFIDDGFSRFAKVVTLIAAAAVLAMIPLSRSVFWGPMAVAIMGGLVVATVLTLLALPAMYAAWFRVKRPAPEVPGAA